MSRYYQRPLLLLNIPEDSIHLIFQKESGESFCPVDLEIQSQIGKFKASFPDDRVEKTQITKLIPYGEYPVYSTL